MLDEVLGKGVQQLRVGGRVGHAHVVFGINQTAVSLHALTETCDVGMVSAVNVDSLLACGIKSVVNTEAFLAEALERTGCEEVAVMTHGSVVLPRVEG